MEWLNSGKWLRVGPAHSVHTSEEAQFPTEKAQLLAPSDIKPESEEQVKARIARHNFSKPLTTDRVAELLYKYSSHLIAKTYQDPTKFDDLIKKREYMFEVSPSSIIEEGSQLKTPNPEAGQTDEEERQQLTKNEKLATQSDQHLNQTAGA
jgi:hypothetical protein